METPQNTAQQKQLNFDKALSAASRAAYCALVSVPDITRFLRLIHLGDGMYKCVWGGFNEAWEPVVCFVDGISLIACLQRLGLKLRNKDFVLDKYAGDEDFAYGIKVADRLASLGKGWPDLG